MHGKWCCTVSSMSTNNCHFEFPQPEGGVLHDEQTVRGCSMCTEVVREVLECAAQHLGFSTDPEALAADSEEGCM